MTQMATRPSDRALLRRQSRHLGLILAVVASSAAFLKHQSQLIAVILGVLGVALAVSALAVPGWLIPVTRAWLRLGVVVHRVVGPIVLGGLWLVMFTPVGIVRRTLGRDPMYLKYDRTVASSWHVRERRRYSLDDFRQQY